VIDLHSELLLGLDERHAGSSNVVNDGVGGGSAYATKPRESVDNVVYVRSWPH